MVNKCLANQKMNQNQLQYLICLQSGESPGKPQENCFSLFDKHGDKQRQHPAFIYKFGSDSFGNCAAKSS